MKRKRFLIAVLLSMNLGDEARSIPDDDIKR